MAKRDRLLTCHGLVCIAHAERLIILSCAWIAPSEGFMFTPVILAGGSGSRLWPLSRQRLPKQFLELDGQGAGTMFQRTLARLDGLQHDQPLVVSNVDHRFVVAEQLRAAKRIGRRIILEPLARNTAPAIALAALEACRDGDDPVLLVLAADHYVADERAFRAAR